MIKTINLVNNLDSLFENGNFNIDLWQSYINVNLNNHAHLFMDELNDYLISGIYTYEDFLPIFNNVYHNVKLDELVNNFNIVTNGLNDKVIETLGYELDVDIILYMGLANGAGWVTELDGKTVILLGVEKILELNWTSIDDLYGLIYHELGHVLHAQNGKLDLNDDSFITQLFSEGLAMYVEQLLVNDMSYFHQNKGEWLAFCSDALDMLKHDFNADLVTMTQFNQRYFGDWVNYYGFSDTGYFLGNMWIKALAKKYTLAEIINFDDEKIKNSYEEYIIGNGE